MKQGTNTFDGRLFRPSVTRRVTDAGASTRRHNMQQLYTTGTVNTSSFRYDPVGSPIKSTQQLNIDHSRFENHTFFNSAEVKTNVSFENIANRYPFDGDRRDVEIFHDSLTGFERWVFDQLPKNVGYLKFEGGSFIKVDDHAGVNFPAISRDGSGASVLDPGTNPVTFEMHVHLPPIANDDQVIIQKLSGTQHGFTLGIRADASTTSADLFMSFVSASAVATLTGTITKGDAFTHIAAIYDRRDDVDAMLIYSGGILIASSSITTKMGTIDFNLAPLYVGTGSTVVTGSGGSTFIPASTFSGALDELRIYHAVRAQSELTRYMYRNVFAEPTLKLYFKFNEPSGTIGQTSTDRLNRVVLDSSGNSLTSFIDESTFSFMLRSTGSIAPPLTYEQGELNPILFMLFEPTVTLNRSLLHSASLYDDVNPNIITKLIPSHYLDEGQVHHAFDNVTGTVGDSIVGGMPGELSIGEPQLLSTLLYIIASELDELKLFIEHLANVIHVDYDEFDSTPDQFLNFAAAYRGFELPALFSEASAGQFVNANDVDSIVDVNMSLRTIQNNLWRRVLTNMNEIIRSKGTQHSIKTFLRTLGIDPEAGFRIKEYGGVRTGGVNRQRERRNAVVNFIEIPASTGAITYIVSQPLVAEHHNEPGFPLPAGTTSDVLLTSGSWTYEAVYRFPIGSSSVVATSSLVRLLSDDYGVLFSLHALSGTYAASSSVVLYGKPVSGALGNTLQLAVTGCNIVDGDHWHVAFGRQRNDDPVLVGDHISSSYFIHITRMSDTYERFTTSSYFMEATNNDHSLNMLHTGVNVFSIGSLRWTPAVSADYLVGTQAVETMALCRVGQLRCWSKALTTVETFEHARNIHSMGVVDPAVNFNDVRNATGSWGRLRFDINLDQHVTMSNHVGMIDLFDFSQNELHLTASEFTVNSTVIHPEQLTFSMLSSRFDEATTDDKVRIHGFTDPMNVELHGGSLGPVYQTSPTAALEDDPRLTIDFSVVDALNDDIMNIFASLDAFDMALGGIDSMFESEYSDLTRLRDTYFDRLVDKINLRWFFEYFRWFDVNIGSFIEQLIPYRTTFLGTSYVVESHVLERPKFRHKFDSVYIGESVRHRSTKSSLIQLIAGSAKRY
jgi:hypothetical protein